jgi:hypothetical protein
MPHHTLKRGRRAAPGLSAALLAVAACWSLPATAQGAAGARAAPRVESATSDRTLKPHRTMPTSRDMPAQ